MKLLVITIFLWLNRHLDSEPKLYMTDELFKKIKIDNRRGSGISLFCLSIDGLAVAKVMWATCWMGVEPHNHMDWRLEITEITVTERPPNPWHSEEITEAKKLRRKLERKWQKTKLEVDRQCFRTQRQIVWEMIKQAKASYFKRQISILC